MISKILVLLLTCGTLLLARTLSQKEIDQVHARLEQQQMSRASLQMNFLQSLRLPGERNETISRGTLQYLKPGRLRIDFSEPTGDLVIINPKLTVIARQNREPRLEPVDATHPPRGSHRMLLEFLERPPQTWSREYRITMEEQGTHLHVTLIPRVKSNSLPERITVLLDSNSGNPVEINLQIQKARLNYTFSGHRQPTDLPMSRFEWKTSHVNKTTDSSRPRVPVH